MDRNNGQDKNNSGRSRVKNEGSMNGKREKAVHGKDGRICGAKSRKD